MSLRSFVVRALGLVCAILLSSCIDSREEFWVTADGSGRAEITCSIPATVTRMHGGDPGMRKLITDYLQATPEFTRSACEVVTANGRTRVSLQLEFDSAMDLKDFVSGPSFKRLPAVASHFAGIIKVDVRGRTVDFVRTISPGKALPGSAFLPASQFDGCRLVYIMHLPAAATATNATRVEDGGRTLVWDLPLAQAVKSPVVTRFKMDIPVPWKLVTAIALPLALSCGFVFLRLRKGNRSPPPAILA